MAPFSTSQHFLPLRLREEQVDPCVSASSKSLPLPLDRDRLLLQSKKRAHPTHPFVESFDCSVEIARRSLRLRTLQILIRARRLSKTRSRGRNLSPRRTKSFKRCVDPRAHEITFGLLRLPLQKAIQRERAPARAVPPRKGPGPARKSSASISGSSRSARVVIRQRWFEVPVRAMQLAPFQEKSGRGRLRDSRPKLPRFARANRRGRVPPLRGRGRKRQ